MKFLVADYPQKIISSLICNFKNENVETVEDE